MTTIEEARTLLSARRQELTDRLGSIESGRRRLGPAALPDADDRARLLSDKEVLDRLSEVTREELGQVVHALDRLESGRYGICEQCSRPIKPARLHVAPEATRCALCGAGRLVA